MSGRRASGSDSSRGAASEVAAVVTASGSHVGRVRGVNQDAHGEWRDDARREHLLLVADGMGGHRGGEVASRLAVEQIGQAFGSASGPPRDWLEGAFARANLAIFEKARGDFELAGMGTTGVALLLTGEPRALVAHVGDSRAYRLRDGALELLTADHSVVGELVRRGQLTSEQARVHPQSNEILRAIGTQPDVEVELGEIDVRPGDRLLLCSDGLSGMLPDAEIAAVLAGTPSASAAVAKLIERANAAGGTDNITVQVADVVAAPARAAAPAPESAGGRGPGGAPAAGSFVRWAVAIALVGALLLLLLGGVGRGA